jgi:2-dehydro-3-deoxygluconokinase
MKNNVPSAVSFGETMIRFSPKNYERIEQAHELDMGIGGAESNFAIAFSRLGGKSAWISKLKKGELGKFILNKIREHGVDVGSVIWTDDYRNGIYFIEFGRKPRATQVIYDRKASAISNVDPYEIDWDIISNYDLFHTTGITVALSENCRKAVDVGIDKAIKFGTKVSFDVNYRSKLWQPEEALSLLNAILYKVDILFVTKEDAENVLKIEGEPEQVIKRIYEKYGSRVIVLTLGSEGAMAFSDAGIFTAEPYELEVVDRIGAGDAFDAGFVYEYLRNGCLEKALKFGLAVSAFAHTIKGDVVFVEKDEIESIMSLKTNNLSR